MVTGLIQLPNRIQQRFQRQTEPGTPPGAIVPHPDEPAPIVRLVMYEPSACSEHEIADIESIPELINRNS